MLAWIQSTRLRHARVGQAAGGVRDARSSRASSASSRVIGDLSVTAPSARAVAASHLVVLAFGELFVGQLARLVIGVRRCREQVRTSVPGQPRPTGAASAAAVARRRSTARGGPQGAGERLDRRQQPLSAGSTAPAPTASAPTRVPSFSRSSRACRYSSSSADSRSSGASAGSPSMAISTTLPLREARRRSRAESSFSRRTITASSCFALFTGTPRQNRCGSRISSSAEKLLEWPLCGVADRNSRCSKRGASSRTALVNSESMA